VRRFASIGIAIFAALVTAALVLGANITRDSYAIVILGVQLLFVVVWTLANRPPALRVVLGAGLAVAVASNVAAAWAQPASLAPLAYVTAAGFVLAAIGQLLRPIGRIRVTESLGSSLVVTLGVVSFATLIVLTRFPRGMQSAEVCLLAAGTAIVVARLTDVVLPVPRLAPQVPRGGLGVVLGAMAGTGVAGLGGYYLAGLTTTSAALAGLVTAVVAVMVDLSVGYSDASRRIDGDTPAPWLARHLQGPLGALALASPAAYAVGVLLLRAF
jgi:hypothetical protein